MPLVMEKRITFGLDEIEGLTFQCQKCEAKLSVSRSFDALKFNIRESKVIRCPACDVSWLETIDKEAVSQEDRDHADKILEGLQHFRERANGNIPWRILLELPGNTD